MAYRLAVVSLWSVVGASSIGTHTLDVPLVTWGMCRSYNDSLSVVAGAIPAATNTPPALPAAKASMTASVADTVHYDPAKNIIAAEVDQAIETHVKETFGNEDELYWMKQAFLRDGYLKVTDIVPAFVKNMVAGEARSLLSQHAKRRDLRIAVTGDSPRRMSNVRQQDIARWGKVIPAVYHSRSLINFLSRLANEDIIENPWEFEKFIVNRQEKAGDTHGWHWGDYPYSMIWVIETPDASHGGILETVPHTYWDKRNPRVEEHLLRNTINSKIHLSGDVYLLKSDTTLHRVMPLVKDATRIIINMAWERGRDKNREVSHETFAFRD